ncbi:hypothetical protein Slin15195_G017050 [Septoria linicola]|uniref:Lytic polysaccharide monooxygenase n=1 Tax=Septoria linicola TaxID=215465 RepID=A0A9Q9APD1_9PEZI|nr:hypothetical protein Slin14017_G017110 [Septoria linicola]USW48386.1 hypothetical protein Slin15195_G017050 [Septoria linicola]
MARLQELTGSWLLCGFLLWPTLGVAHMEMSWPWPLHSKYDPQNDYTTIDYSMTAPLSPDGSNFPCKGYQNGRPFRPVTTYTPGSAYNITLAGSATHSGGSCQLSLSYDNGATFRVIQSMIGGCPLTSTYDFTIPSHVPSGEALLSWTWQNNEGNREFYQNCAQVTIESSVSRRRKRQSSSSFEGLPFIWKANLEGINDCTTTEGEDPVYPNPGPAVVYAGGLSASSAATEGTCDWPTPYGLTYEDLGDSALDPGAGDVSSYDSKLLAAHSPPADPIVASTTPEVAVSTSAHWTSTTASPTRPALDDSATELVGRSASITPTPSARDFAPKKLVSVLDQSTVTVTADCESTVTVTISTTFPAPTMLTTTRRTSSGPNTTPQPTAVSRPPYATGDVNAAYLPCVPGTFLCTSRTTYLTCNYNDGSLDSEETWVYADRYQQSVAAGMECLPMLAPSPASSGNTSQQDSTPDGQYRDDRYVRARPEGDCAVDGSLQCTYGGEQFSICDHGGW